MSIPHALSILKFQNRLYTLKKKNKVPLALRIVPTVFPWLERFFPTLANRLFIFLFFTPLKYQATEKERKAETFSEKFQIESDGKRIQCYRWGNGNEVVLVVHGWAGRATQFRRFIKPLTRAGYQVVGFDGPAHGQSEGRSTNLDEFQHVIHALVKQLGNVSAILTHSFGGITASYALSNGLPVKTLINVASPTISDEIIKTYLRALGGSEKTGEAFKKYVLKMTGKPFSAFSALEFIKQVPASLNLLLVHDEDDQEVIMDHPRELLKQFPQGQMLQTKGLGHTRILKDNDVIRHIVTFIQRHSSNS